MTKILKKDELHKCYLDMSEDNPVGSKEWLEFIRNTDYTPSQFKYNVLREYSKRFNCVNLVEFGTYWGYCALYLLDDFENIYTIEPVKEYYDKSKKLLSQFDKVHLFNKKSIQFIDEDLHRLRGKTLFWIDDHVQPPYTENASNDLTDVLYRLVNNLDPKNYIFVIDDFRLWGEWSDKSLILNFLEENSIELILSNDIVLFVPKNEILK